MISLFEKYSLKKHNSFGVDASSKYFAEIDDEADLVHFLRHNPVPDLDIMILGSGNNILFINDFDGLIIHPAIKGIEVIHENTSHISVRVGAGETWDTFVEWAVNQNLGGIENLSLIPGSVGASPVQNIGAYGCEVSEVIDTVETIRIRDGLKKYYSSRECRFGYRSSIFKTDPLPGVIITNVVYRLSREPVLKTSYGAIEARLKEYKQPSLRAIREVIIRIRSEKLPDPQSLGNAGSFFENPVIPEKEFQSFIRKYPDAPAFPAEQPGYQKIPAAWLIEKCGWKGRRIGNAGTYPLQPLVLVNFGNATGKEIYELSEMIREDVKKEFNIHLETEVNIAGLNS